MFSQNESSTSPSWQSIAKTAQDHRDATIAQISPVIPDITDLPGDSTPIPATILTAEENNITTSPPELLLARLHDSSLSSQTVTKAFLRRAAIAQKLVNCVTELLLDIALTRAAYLDDYLAQHKQPIGPLHGLPISVKEHVELKGMTCNAGFIAWHDRVPKSNAHMVDILLAAGAVLYVRTTQPQTLMHLETSSNFYGATINPFNRVLTSGGSSGGEGALVGIRGSCLGIGTDIGGSIRSPAANNGVYGLRPTSYRLPMEGLSATMQGQEQIVPVIGPLSTSLEGVEVFVKTLIDAKPWIREPSLLPIPWKTEAQFPLRKDGSKTIKIGLLLDDGVVRPHPPVLRALNEMASKLKQEAGIEVVEFKPYQHDRGWKIISSLYFCDGGEEESAAIAASGEPWRPLSKFIITENPNMKKLSIGEMWDLTSQREAYRAEYSKHWEESGIDILLCPVGPGAAPPLDCARYWGYTAQWNVLDYPALVAPITKVDPEVDVQDKEYVPRNEHDKYNHELYEPMKYANAPVSVQFVSRRYEDEKIIEAAKYIIEKLQLPWAKFT